MWNLGRLNNASLGTTKLCRTQNQAEKFRFRSFIPAAMEPLRLRDGPPAPHDYYCALHQPCLSSLMGPVLLGLCVCVCVWVCVCVCVCVCRRLTWHATTSVSKKAKGPGLKPQSLSPAVQAGAWGAPGIAPLWVLVTVGIVAMLGLHWCWWVLLGFSSVAVAGGWALAPAHLHSGKGRRV